MVDMPNNCRRPAHMRYTHAMRVGLIVFTVAVLLGFPWALHYVFPLLYAAVGFCIPGWLGICFISPYWRRVTAILILRCFGLRPTNTAGFRSEYQARPRQRRPGVLALPVENSDSSRS